MRAMVIGLSLLVCGSAWAGVSWEKSYSRAVSKAKKQNKLVFLFFHKPG